MDLVHLLFLRSILEHKIANNNVVYRLFFLNGLLCFHLTMMAQLTRISDGSYRFEPLLDRLYKVSQIIPQEKVYIHMDNTCYFQGIFP